MKNLPRLLPSLVLLLVFTARLGPPVATAQQYRPQIAEASADAELALQTFVLPEGVQGSLLAAEPDVANPVAFYVTNDGRVYICETFRQQKGVEDNRSHMDWLNNDLRLQTVEERLAMFKRYLGPDVQKYGEDHDRIRLLRDTTGDGRLDTATVYADGFNDILDGTGAGVIEVDGKVYYTCIPKLWMLEDTDSDGVADQREALHHGYGIRVAFRGHDMHGLVRGPDGRLYFSIGDRGYNVITKEGDRLKRPDTGAVFRCDPDGSHLEVFAYGLRNPQELAFDNEGNLFSVDNNSDSGDQARLTYIVQESDTGWRMYYQYLSDRGPWNRERMWYAYRADDQTTAVQPAWILPPLANISDGPSGLTFYPGLGMEDRYRDHFFLADFRGGSSNSGIRSFSVQSKGASFEPVDSHQYIWSILATDVDFAPDGSLYVSDWVNGWNGEGKGRLYRFEQTDEISAVKAAGVPQLLAGGIAAARSGRLFELLGHDDRRVRQEAQFELVKRGDVDSILSTAATSDDALVQRHLAWAIWQLGLQSPEQARRVIPTAHEQLKTHRHDETAVQYLRVVSDFVRRHGRAAVISSADRQELRGTLSKLIADSNPRVAGFAAVALGQVGTTNDVSAVEQLLVRANGTDPVIRHQSVVALAALATKSPGAIDGTAKHDNPVVRQAAVLAYSRAGDIPALRAMTQDANSDVVLSAARMLLNERDGVGEEAVAGIKLTPASSSALIRRVLEANYRIGRASSAARVAAVAADASRPEAIRLVATDMLKSWNRPQPTDTVTGRWRKLPDREVEGLTDAIRPHIVRILGGPPELRKAAVEVAATYRIQDIVPTLQEIYGDPQADESLRVAAFRALSSLGDHIEDLLAEAQQDPSEAVRMAALEVSADRDPEIATPVLIAAARSGSVALQQKALRLLGGLKTPAAEQALLSAFERLEQDQLDSAVVLDLLVAAETHGSDRLQQLLLAFRQEQQQSGSKLALWRECLKGGDVERGRAVFFGRAAASCRRCHMVNGEGANVGPDLSAIAKDKDRRYLLEAIVDPNAAIAKGFETTIIVDADGRIHSGIIKEENEDVVRLMTPQGALVTVPTDEIEDRARGLSGMPADITKGLSRDDVRDLVEYLSTLKVAQKTGSHGNSEE